MKCWVDILSRKYHKSQRCFFNAFLYVTIFKLTIQITDSWNNKKQNHLQNGFQFVWFEIYITLNTMSKHPESQVHMSLVEFRNLLSGISSLHHWLTAITKHNNNQKYTNLEHPGFRDCAETGIFFIYVRKDDTIPSRLPHNEVCLKGFLDVNRLEENFLYFLP